MNPQSVSQAMAIRASANSGIGRFIYYLALVAFGVVLMAVSAKIKVPLWPNPTPVTMQTFVVLALAAAYGSRLGTATMLSYLGAGAAGVPVFTGTPEQGIGIAYMMGATGGYLAAYPIAAWIVGRAADAGWSRSPIRIALPMLAGECVILVLGALWMGALFGADKIIAWGVGPFIVTDLIKLALAACAIPAIWSLLPGQRS